MLVKHIFIQIRWLCSLAIAYLCYHGCAPNAIATTRGRSELTLSKLATWWDLCAVENIRWHVSLSSFLLVRLHCSGFRVTQVVCASG